MRHIQPHDVSHNVVKMQSVHYPSAAMKKIRIAQFGLGPIGVETLKLAATKPWAEIIGGIDIDPAKIGRDLGELTEAKSLRGRNIYSSLEALLGEAAPDVVFHTSVSNFESAFT